METKKVPIKLKVDSLKSKVNKLLARLIRKKRGPNKIRNERAVITDTTETQAIIRDYYKQLYTNELEILGKKVDKFLGIPNLPTPNHEEMEDLENVNRPIISNELSQ